MLSKPPVLPHIIFFTSSTTQPPFVEGLAHALTGRNGHDHQYRMLRTASEILPTVEATQVCVLIANCLRKEEITELYNILPSLEPRVADGTLRILVLNSLGHPGLGTLLRARSTLEVVELPITLKILQHKLKIAIQVALQNFLKTNADSKTSTRKKVKSAGVGVSWQSAMDFHADFWWIPGPKNIRNVVGVWLIDLLGPGPSVGVWEEILGMERAGEKGWAWRSRGGGDDLFNTPDGRWVFYGKQPEFSWQKNLWSFVSKHPMLAFYPTAESDPQYVRFEHRGDEGLLFLENSRHTRGMLPRIQRSFETRMGIGLGPDESEEVDWKDHTGAVGVVLPPKDQPVDETGQKVHPFRNALQSSKEAKRKLGLHDLSVQGVSSGTEAYEKIQFSADIIAVNGVPGVGVFTDVIVYDVNSVGATLLLQPPAGVVGDRFECRFKFDVGETRMECSMVLELGQIEFSESDRQLVSGDFRRGDYETLSGILERLEERKRELKNFYAIARGEAG